MPESSTANRSARNAALLVIALMVGALGIVAPTGASADTGPPLTRQTRQLNPVDVVCLVDDSGSEFGTDGTDPFALRYRACSLAAHYLAAVATDGLDHRFGVISFGSTVRIRTPELLDLPRQLSLVDRAIEGPTNMGDTNYAAGIRAATSLLGPPSEHRRQIVLVMGDGVPDVPGLTHDEAFADIRSAVADSPGDVLVFQADPAGRAADLESHWAAQGVDAVQRIDSLRDGSLERAYIDALRRAVGMDRGDEVQLSADRPTATIDVPNYLEAMTITWFAPGVSTLQVTPASGGRSVTLHRSAVGTHSFRLPRGGQWRIQLTQGEGAAVAVDLVPVAAAVLTPSSSAPQGRDLVVEATFATTSGTAVEDVDTDPRYFGAVVTDPRGRTTHVELRRDVRGRYRATHAVRLDRTGTWRVDLVMKSRDGNVVGQAGAPFAVSTTPWLSIDEPKVRSRRTLEVPITLRRDVRPASADDVLGEDPQAAVVASLLDGEGRVLETVRARWTGGSRFAARFRSRLDDGERAWVRAQLGSQDRAGRPIADATEATVTAQPSSGALWAQRIRLALAVLLMLAVSLVLAYAAWVALRPGIHGRIDLSSFGGPATMRLDGGRWRRVDGRGLRSAWLWADRSGTVHRNVGLVPWPFRAELVPATRRPTAARG